MKIEQKIVFSTALNLGLILLIGLFSLQDLNLVLTKLRFTAIADELNASFLEMRLSEKNYFLYQDAAALDEIHANLARTTASIDSASGDIASAIGDENLRTLKVYARAYAAAVEDVRVGRLRGNAAQDRLRREGRRLKDFSEAVTRAERDRVKGIISSAKRFFFFSFGAVLLLALGVSHFISQKILRSLRAIENVAKSISAGNFDTVGGELPHDEMGAVLQAVNSMSEELKNREEALIQSKKLASIGILTAGVAHELTNPLNNISMIAQNYAEYLRPAQPGAAARPDGAGRRAGAPDRGDRQEPARLLQAQGGEPRGLRHQRDDPDGAAADPEHAGHLEHRAEARAWPNACRRS